MIFGLQQFEVRRLEVKRKLSQLLYQAWLYRPAFLWRDLCAEKCGKRVPVRNMLCFDCWDNERWSEYRYATMGY